jgi:phenylalanyl-tRNA synthetase beta chain
MRHEKGIGHELPRLAADRAARLIAEITGSRIASGIVDNDPDPKPARVVSMDLARTQRLLGIPLDSAGVGELLRPLGFDVREGPPLEIAVPSHRLDVVAPEDVAEEIARAHGYERIPGRLPAPTLPSFRPDPSEPRQRVRRVLAGLGLDEVVLHALIGPDDLVRSGYDPADDGLVRIANPLAEQHSIMRPVMYPSLLGALAENVRQRRNDAWLFEVGKTYWMDGAKGPATAETAGTGRWEAWHVAIALVGPRVPRAPGEVQPPADVATLKGILDALHGALGARPPEYRAETAEELHPHLHPGRAARLLDAGGRAYGSLGEVHPRVAHAWGLPDRPVIAAVNLGQLFALVPAEVVASPIPAAQPIDRDLALSVEESTPLGELLRVLRSSAGPNLVEARVFDVYRGEQVGAGRVSYAIALRFQPETAGAEKGVERAMNRLRGALQHHLGAQIR